MSKLKEFVVITVGAIIAAIGVYFFKFPNHFSTGGVSGISIIFGKLVPYISPATVMLILNVACIIIGLVFLGKSFCIKTVYSSLLLSFVISFLEILFPMTQPLTNQPFLELVFSIILSAVGSAILFNYGASTGGTDVIAMLLRKYTSLDIGKALFCVDALITASAGIIFGIETGLFSFMGLLIKSLLVNTCIENINLSKYFTIITNHPNEISEFINTSLRRGATVYSGKGTFSNEDKNIIITVINSAQAVLLRNFIKKVDNQAFIIISNTSDIIGKGFRETV